MIEKKKSNSNLVEIFVDNLVHDIKKVNEIGAFSI